MILTAISRKIALNIKANAPEHPASLVKLQYGIEAILNTGSILILTLLCSLLFGQFGEACIAMAAFAGLRMISGGYHLKSGVWCILVSTGMLIALTYASFGQAANLILCLISFLLLLLYSPSNIEKQTRIPKQYYLHLKVGALILVVLAAFIGSPVLTASFFVQSLTLIRRRR